MKTAIFPGSFDPFTIGHEDIVRRALGMFDKIVIGIGQNMQKQAMMSEEQRKEYIERVFADEKRVEVEIYKGLTVDFAKRKGASFILRGVRTTADFEYEQQMATVNREIARIETVLLYSLPQYAHISSSIVRELHRYGQDTARYLPCKLKVEY